MIKIFGLDKEFKFIKDLKSDILEGEETFQNNSFNEIKITFKNIPEFKDIKFLYISDNFNQNRLYKFTILKNDGIVIETEGIDLLAIELNSIDYIQEKHFKNATLSVVLNEILKNTGWNVLDLGTTAVHDLDLNYISLIEAFKKIRELWRFEFRTSIKFLNNKVIKKTIEVNNKINNVDNGL